MEKKGGEQKYEANTIESKKRNKAKSHFWFYTILGKDKKSKKKTQTNG